MKAAEAQRGEAAMSGSLKAAEAASMHWVLVAEPELTWQSRRVGADY